MFGRLALVAELVDALVSGTSPRKGVGVRVPSWAPRQRSVPESREVIEILGQDACSRTFWSLMKRAAVTHTFTPG